MSEKLSVTFDEYGFVTDPQQWNQDLATSIAGDLGIQELREDHWKGLEFYRQLFKGPEEAWKIAGLPNPGTEARIYMEDEEEQV